MMRTLTVQLSAVKVWLAADRACSDPSEPSKLLSLESGLARKLVRSVFVVADSSLRGRDVLCRLSSLAEPQKGPQHENLGP